MGMALGLGALGDSLVFYQWRVRMTSLSGHSAGIIQGWRFYKKAS